MDSSFPEYLIAQTAAAQLEEFGVSRRRAPGHEEDPFTEVPSLSPRDWAAGSKPTGNLAVLHRVLSSTREKRYYDMWDVQAEILEDFGGMEATSLECALQVVQGEIDRAAELKNDRAALRELEKVWRHLEDLSSRAEAQFRIRLNTPAPILAKAPEWLNSEVERLRTSAGSIHPPHHLALLSAQRLVRAVCHELASHELRAELAPAPLGRVEIRWVGEKVLRWMVAAAALPWPGVMVRAYEEASPDSLQLKATSFHLANDVVSHARKVLTADHDQRQMR